MSDLTARLLGVVARLAAASATADGPSTEAVPEVSTDVSPGSTAPAWPPAPVTRAVEPTTVRATAPLHLDPGAVAAVLGAHPDAAAVGTLKAEVHTALQQSRIEAATGGVGSGVLTVRGRRLADYLDLELIAEFLRSTPAPSSISPEAVPAVAELPLDLPPRPVPEARRSAAHSPELWPAEMQGVGRRSVQPYARCAGCGTGTWIVYGDRPQCQPCARRHAEVFPP
jgi:hypothetical protein